MAGKLPELHMNCQLQKTTDGDGGNIPDGFWEADGDREISCKPDGGVIGLRVRDDWKRMVS